MTMKDGFNLKALFPRYDGKYPRRYADAGDEIILCVFTTFFCTVGLLGNGNIIRLLGFHIKRKPFAIYLLNLAVADFGSLSLLFPMNINDNSRFFHEYLEFPVVIHGLLMSLSVTIYSSRNLFLAAISIDRWVSILFPNWHPSPVLPTTVCAFIWALPLALIGLPLILLLADLIPGYSDGICMSLAFVSACICLILVVLFSLILLIKACFKSQPCQCGNLLKVTLLILLSSLLFTILTFAFFILFPRVALAYCRLWLSLKSSINPLIYFLVGRQKGGRFQQRIRAMLQRVFKEEREIKVERPPRNQTSKL